MKPYSLDLRQKIVSAYQEGNTSIRKLAQRFMVSNGVVHRLVLQHRQMGSIAPKPARGGQPSQLIGRETEINQMVQDQPDLTLSEYCEVWEEKTGVRVSLSTMCRYLKSQDLTRKKTLSKHSSCH
jgi:putative transposase